MEARPLSLRSWDGLRARLGPGLLLALGVLAYRPLLENAFALPTHARVEDWLFRTSPLPTPLVIAVAAWFLWRRRTRFWALPNGCAPAGVALFALLGAGLFAWAHLTRAADLLLPSLSAHLLAFAAATRAWPGCRAIALPALTLLLSLHIPAPVHEELVWFLQRASASGAIWLVQSLGGELSRGGVILRTPEHSFHVIEGCSGLRGIEILSLVALLVRELFAGSSWRTWLLLPLAPLLGFALNVVRVAYVATSDNPEALAGARGDHTPQGLAVLLAGTLILYGVGYWLAGKTLASRESTSSAHATDPRASWIASGWLALLVAFAASMPPFAAREQPAPKPQVEFRQARGSWVSEPVMGDPLFFGAGGQLLHRRYQPAGSATSVSAENLEVLIGAEVFGNPQTVQILSSKFEAPGPEWDVIRSEPARLWVLRRDARMVVASRMPGGEHAVMYLWKPGDRGLWIESWRSLFALDSTPFRRERPRNMVRITTFAPHGGPLELARARQRLDQFITEFHDDLAAL